MAKRSTRRGDDGRTPPTPKDRKSAFSKSELDAARQLVQLSGNSDESGTAKRKEGGHEDTYDDGTEASSVLREAAAAAAALPFGQNDDNEEDDDGIRRKKRRYRSIEHIYRSTGALVSVVRGESKMKVPCECN